jgi:hypothetical protein
MEMEASNFVHGIVEVRVFEAEHLHQTLCGHIHQVWFSHLYIYLHICNYLFIFPSFYLDSNLTQQHTFLFKFHTTTHLSPLSKFKLKASALCVCT